MTVEKFCKKKTKGNEKIKIKKTIKTGKFTPYKKKKDVSLSKNPKQLSK